MATCLVVEHAVPESAHAIGEALDVAGIELLRCRVYAGDPVPRDTRGVDGLVVMGGPMSAASDVAFPSRRAELELLSDAVCRGVPTLGVCLGAQLLAASGGGAVYPGDGLEVGWAPVSLTPDADDDALFCGLPASWTVLHWHGETFDLPVGSVHLARSARYVNQAFRLGPLAWGVQFHLEVDATAVVAFATEFADEAAAAPGGVGGPTGDAALAALAPIQALVCQRFAELVAASEDRKNAVTVHSGNSIA